VQPSSLPTRRPRASRCPADSSCGATRQGACVCAPGYFAAFAAIISTRAMWRHAAATLAAAVALQVSTVVVSGPCCARFKNSVNSNVVMRTVLPSGNCYSSILRPLCLVHCCLRLRGLDRRCLSCYPWWAPPVRAERQKGRGRWSYEFEFSIGPLSNTVHTMRALQTAAPAPRPAPAGPLSERAPPVTPLLTAPRLICPHGVLASGGVVARRVPPGPSRHCCGASAPTSSLCGFACNTSRSPRSFTASGSPRICLCRSDVVALGAHAARSRPCQPPRTRRGAQLYVSTGGWLEHKSGIMCGARNFIVNLQGNSVADPLCLRLQRGHSTASGVRSGGDTTYAAETPHRPLQCGDGAHGATETGGTDCTRAVASSSTPSCKRRSLSPPAVPLDARLRLWPPMAVGRRCAQDLVEEVRRNSVPPATAERRRCLSAAFRLAKLPLSSHLLAERKGLVEEVRRDSVPPATAERRRCLSAALRLAKRPLSSHLLAERKDLQEEVRRDSVPPATAERRRCLSAPCGDTPRLLLYQLWPHRSQRVSSLGLLVPVLRIQ
jgi:hypothetical protein